MALKIQEYFLDLIAFYSVLAKFTSVLAWRELDWSKHKICDSLKLKQKAIDLVLQ